jgi:hypothetical protein
MPRIAIAALVLAVLAGCTMNDSETSAARARDACHNVAKAAQSSDMMSNPAFHPGGEGLIHAPLDGGLGSPNTMAPERRERC